MSVEFKVGDIVYSKVQHAGCSYYHTFGKVVKILPSGKYRIQPLVAEQGDKREVGWCIFTRVFPDLETRCYEKSFVIGPDGHKKKEGTWTGLWYEKYSQDLVLENMLDGSD